MLSAMEQLIHFHPGSHMGRFDRRDSNLEAFEKLESRPVSREEVYQDYEPQRSRPVWMIGELAATAALVVVFCGVLAVIARFAGESQNTTEDSLVATSDVAETR